MPIPGMRFIPSPNSPLNLFSGLFRTAAAVAAAAAIAGGKFDGGGGGGGRAADGGEGLVLLWRWWCRNREDGGVVEAAEDVLIPLPPPPPTPFRLMGNSSRSNEKLSVLVAGKRRNCWRMRSSSSLGMIVHRVMSVFGVLFMLLLRFGKRVEVWWWGGGEVVGVEVEVGWVEEEEEDREFGDCEEVVLGGGDRGSWLGNT